MGLIAAPLLLTAGVATVFGLTEQGSVWFAPGGALIFVWELSVGVYSVRSGPATLVDPGHRTRLTGTMATAATRAQAPATAYNTP